MFKNVAYISSTLQVDTLKEGIPLPFNLEQADGIFLLIVVCFLFFARIYSGDFAFLKSNISLLRSFKENVKTTQEFTSRDMWYTYFLLMQFALLSSICLYHIFTEQEISDSAIHNPLRTIGLFVLLIFIFLILRIFLYRLVGYMFDRQKEMAIFEYLYIVMLEAMGIIFFIPTLLLVYANYLHTPLTILLVVLLAFGLLRLFYRIIVYFVREKFNFLFLIAYLCSVEIIPYIFLAVGLIYLHKTDELTALW